MSDEHFQEDFYTEPFQPVRLHLVSGKTLDIRRPGLVMPLRDRVMVFRGLAKDGRSAEGYDIIALHNIERMERLDIGKPATGKRKRA